MQVVRLWDSFKHSGPNGVHVCMLFEPMGPNLLALIKHYNYRGIPMDMVRSITRQVNPPKEIQEKYKEIKYKGPLDRSTHLKKYKKNKKVRKMIRSIAREGTPT